MAGLPKKYAKMGFKKGWAAYRGFKRKKSVPRAAPKKVKHMARRRYGRKARRSKKGMFKLVKGIVYTGAIAAPMYVAYKQLGGGADGAVGALKTAAFIDNGTGKFSLAAGSQIWMPVAAVALVDFATSKLKVQSYISRGVNNLLG